MSQSIIQTEDLNAYVGDVHILKGITAEFKKNRVTAIMGPSGCGKSTLIRCINRMHEMTPNATITGKIRLYGKNLRKLDQFIVRRKIGMVFQRPNPFPTMSISENVLAGYKLNSIKLSKEESDEIVAHALQKVGLWDEVKDDLHRKGTFLSGGQQQRLCIARTLALNPQVILLDEPTSALDPKATERIEQLIMELKDTVSIILVTHNMNQAARIADESAFLFLGELVEFGATKALFENPKEEKTKDYLSGVFG